MELIGKMHAGVQIKVSMFVKSSHIRKFSNFWQRDDQLH